MGAVGVKVKESRSRLGNSVPALPPAHHADQETSRNPPVITRNWHGCYPHCTEEETEAQDKDVSTVTQPVNGGAALRTGVVQPLSPPSSHHPSTRLPPSFLVNVGSMGAGTGVATPVQPPDTLSSPGWVQAHAHVCTRLSVERRGGACDVCLLGPPGAPSTA